MSVEIFGCSTYGHDLVANDIDLLVLLFELRAEHIIHLRGEFLFEGVVLFLHHGFHLQHHFLHVRGLFFRLFAVVHLCPLARGSFRHGHTTDTNLELEL